MKIVDTKKFVISNQDIADNAETYLWGVPVDGSYEVIFRKITKTPPKKKRTLTQNAALHKYFWLLSQALNEAGYDVGATIKVPVSFTPETVKEYLFKPVMKALHPDKVSTTELTTTEVSEVYEELNRLTSDKFGVGVGFPDRFSV